MKKPPLEKYAIIDGNPYGAALFGRHIFVSSLLFINKEYNVEKIFEEYKTRLIPLIDDDMKILESSVIYRPPYFSNSGLDLNATIAFSGLLWGRAYKVHRYFQKHSKRSKKVWINGHRKMVKS